MLFRSGIFFFDKETEEYQPLIIVNDSINTLLCQRGKNVNVLQNTPETVLLLSESPYSYHLIKKKFTPIVSVGKTAIDGVIQPVCNDSTRSFLHDLKHIYRLDSLNRLLPIHTCYEDTVFNSISLDENGLFWIGSNHGLSYYSTISNKRTCISNELIDEISALICDKRGKVWLGTEGKLFAHLIEKKEFRNLIKDSYKTYIKAENSIKKRIELFSYSKEISFVSTEGNFLESYKKNFFTFLMISILKHSKIEEERLVKYGEIIICLRTIITCTDNIIDNEKKGVVFLTNIKNTIVNNTLLLMTFQNILTNISKELTTEIDSINFILDKIHFVAKSEGLRDRNLYDSYPNSEFLIKEMARVTKNGRINAVHCTDVFDNTCRLWDFPHEIIKLYEKYGFECTGDVGESAGLTYQPMALQRDRWMLSAASAD